MALAGAIEAFWFLGLSLLLGLLRAGYDPTHDAISRLGEQGSAPPLVWNVGGFGIAAALYALYAIAVADEFGRGLMFWVTLIQAVTITTGERCRSPTPAADLKSEADLNQAQGR